MRCSRRPARVCSGRRGDGFIALEDRTLPSVSLTAAFAGLASAGVGSPSPPDPEVAVGPTKVVQVVNSRVAFFDKATGYVLGQQSLQAFFAPAGAGPGQFDPTVTYDELAGRFVVEALEPVGAPVRGYFVDFAVSNDSDPTHGFAEVHRINVTEYNAQGVNLRGDFDRVGWNADAYVITLDQMQAGADVVNNVEVLTVNKATVLDGNSGSFFYTKADLPGPANFFLIPARMHGATKGGPFWFVEDTAAGTALRVVEEVNVLGAAPAFATFDVPAPFYGDAPKAPQPGGTQLDPDGDNILNVVWRGNRLLASQTVSSGGAAHARWYELSTASTAPVLVQWGEVDPGPGVFTYYPAIDVAPNGDLGMVFLESSATEFLSVYATGQKLGSPAGWMEPPVLLMGGRAAYTDVGGSPYRAGDFSGIAVDPATGAFWGDGEYATAAPGGTNWATWVAGFYVYVPLSPASVPEGSGSFRLTVNGSGFTPGSVVSLGGVALTTAYVSATQLWATVPAAFAAEEGVAAVTVSGAMFAAQSFFITAGPGSPPQAGTDVVTGRGGPVTFSLTPGGALYRHDSLTGWIHLGDFIQTISAVADGSGNAVVFAVMSNQALYRNDLATGWLAVGGAGTVQSVSAGTDANGLADVFVLTTSAALTEWSGSAGWSPAPLGLPGSVLTMSALKDDAVVVVTADRSVYEHNPRFGWFPLAGPGFALSVSAVTDTTGQEVVFALGTNRALFRHDATGWSELGAAGTMASVSAGLDAAGRADVFVTTVVGTSAEYDPSFGWAALGAPGTAGELSAAGQGQAVAVINDGSVWEYDPTFGWLRLTAAGFADH